MTAAPLWSPFLICASTPACSGVLFRAIDNLSADLVRVGNRRNEVHGGTIPHLAQALAQSGRSDVACLLHTGVRRDFSEAQRRLHVLAESGELSRKIQRILTSRSAQIGLFLRSPSRVSHAERAIQISLDLYTQHAEPVAIDSSPRPKPKQAPSPPKPYPYQAPLVGLYGGGTSQNVHEPTPLGTSDPDALGASPWAEGLFVMPQQSIGIPHSGIAINEKGLPLAVIDPDFRLRYHPTKSADLPGPVLPRMGSKKHLMARFDLKTRPLMPRVRFRTFVDVFGGSLSALAFMVRTGRVGPETQIIISDIHPQVHAIYKAIRDDVDEFIRELERLHRGDIEAQYYKLREEFNRNRDMRVSQRGTEAAARYLFMLTYCYGSVLRENTRSSHINVKIRRDFNKRGVSKTKIENFRLMSRVLRDAILINGPYDQFWHSLPRDLSRTFVYMDPPYWGQETTTEYGVPPFLKADQQNLAHLFFELQQRGVWAAVSSSDRPFIRGLFQEAPALWEIKAPDRLAAPKGKKKVRHELLILNYRMPWMARSRA